MRMVNFQMIVEAFRRSGLTIEEWAKRADISLGTASALSRGVVKGYSTTVLSKAVEPFGLEVFVGPAARLTEPQDDGKASRRSRKRARG